MVKEKEGEMKEWYEMRVEELVGVWGDVWRKYRGRKVGKWVGWDLWYIMEEVLEEEREDDEKRGYVNVIVDRIMRRGRGDDLMMGIGKVMEGVGMEEVDIVGDM